MPRHSSRDYPYGRHTQSGETLTTATIVIEPDAIQSNRSAVSSAKPPRTVRADISLIRRDRNHA
jgi:hypothetical protein